MVICACGCIFTMVFHRILDFKNGAGFLSSPFLFAETTLPDNARLYELWKWFQTNAAFASPT
jgi:hypothetical protein